MCKQILTNTCFHISPGAVFNNPAKIRTRPKLGHLGVEGTAASGPSTIFERFRTVGVILPSGTVARAKQLSRPSGVEVTVNGENIPVTVTEFGRPEDLPDPDGETKYFVSLITAQAAKAVGRETNDLFFPGCLIRGQKGEIVGLLSLAQL